jgi:hypothetical protein
VKTVGYLIFGLLMIGAIAYCGYEFRAELGLSGGRQATPAPDQAHVSSIVWQKVDQTQDCFRLEMPAGSHAIEVPAYDEHGGKQPVNMIEASPDPQTTYAIAWADHPPVELAAGHGADRLLDMARDGALTRTQTALLGESREDHDGYPARDFSSHNEGGGVLNARFIVAGSRLYMLIATFPSANARRDEDVNRFFDSLSLTASPRCN